MNAVNRRGWTNPLSGQSGRPPRGALRRGWILLALIVAVAVVAAACTGSRDDQRLVPPGGQALTSAPGGEIRDFSLTAAPATLELRPGLKTDVWAYNGTVPGPELRVKVGDLIRVHLTNNLPTGTTIHWHGLRVPNRQDGVAGVTQDAIPSGGQASYAFVATTAGTYWYHPHQNSADQEDRGLYGIVIVEPRDGTPPAALDEALVYDEWPTGTPQATAPPGDDASMVRYGVYSVNGRTGNGIHSIRFQSGSIARLRLVNAGFLTHYIHIHGVQFQIVATDGHELVGGPLTDHAVTLGAGERIDVQFIAPGSAVWVHAHDPSAPAGQIGVPLLPVGEPVPATMPGQDESISATVLDLLNYPARAVGPVWTDSAKASKAWILTLNESMGGMADSRQGMPGMTGMPTRYSINGKTFPNTDTLVVKDGDRVILTFVNKGRLEHPMHVHGHAFQVLALDGQPVASQLVKDTVLVEPGSSVTVGFVANNPGWWMVHCHELHHANGGMALLVTYGGTVRPAQMGGAFGNSSG